MKTYTITIVELVKKPNDRYTNTYTRTEESYFLPLTPIVSECQDRLKYEDVISVSFGVIENELEIFQGTIFKK